MKPVAVLQNEADAPAGYLGITLDRLGLDWYAVRLDTGEPVPSVGDVAGVAVLGGAMGAYDEEAFPFLADEKRLLAACTERGVPVLGICLGCQLLADALGGRTYLSDRAEVVFAPIVPNEAGRRDPVVAAMDGHRVVRFHRDTFDLPPGATVLATGGGFIQAFRVGRSIGIQPHPEVTPDLLASWLADGGGRALAIASGTDPDRLVAEFRAAEPRTAAMASAVFEAWTTGGVRVGVS